MAFATCATSRSSGERSLHTGFAELSCPDRLKGRLAQRESVRFLGPNAVGP